MVKGIFSDFFYIFLWHESEDMNKKVLVNFKLTFTLYDVLLKQDFNQEFALIHKKMVSV